MFEKEKNFEFFEYERFINDFCYNKPFELLFRAANQRTKLTLDQLIEVKNGKCSLLNNITLNHSISQNKTFCLTGNPHSIGLKYQFKLPNAQHENESNDPNDSKMIYSSISSDRKLQNATLSMGIDIKTNWYMLDSSILGVLAENKNQYYIYNKLIYSLSSVNVGLLSIFDCRHTNLQTNNIVLQYKFHPKHQIFARAEVDGVRNYSMKYNKISNYFDFVIVNYLFKPTQTLRMMAEIKYDLNNYKVKMIQSLIEKTFPQKKLKFKFNHLADITLQMQFPFRSLSENSIFNFGIQVADILKGRKISYGFRIDANY